MRQEILIYIVDNETYEKDAVFYVELGEPVRDEESMEEFERQRDPNSKISFDEKIAQLGKPKLGEIYRCAVRIKESKEFKNTVDKLISKANTKIMMGTSSWKDQFIDAITVSAGDDEEGDDEEGDGGEREEKLPTCSDYVMHLFTLFWKILFAFVPPTDYFNGWLCFVVSIIMIGALTAVIGDLASHFGCTVGLIDSVTAFSIVALGTSVPEIADGWACFVASIVWIGILTAIVGDLASHFGCTVGLKDSITAISFVALGTSIPDTFASKVAAQNDQFADSSIGNVTGSNAVNVFLGIGIAWTVAAIVHAYRGTVFRVNPGSLVYSVTLFSICAFLTCIVLMFRRRFGGELGGPMLSKLPTVILFVIFWLFYVLMSSLEAYHIIPGF
ncbi:unnamed protein product [Medioppia subpectinata]|uniref:Sodium/calcium exchanger membrane region domain-containing protein n=1 Tax=Medioppia subpectinata TaxID=1979941 RepID=A0A7R9KRR9_9ACAR|nr:unnamed protein product [Medioppia subpectinata]CAG2107412.1 unnamed protein product [Medioppia subpectinata]